MNNPQMFINYRLEESGKIYSWPIELPKDRTFLLNLIDLIGKETEDNNPILIGVNDYYGEKYYCVFEGLTTEPLEEDFYSTDMSDYHFNMIDVIREDPNVYCKNWK